MRIQSIASGSSGNCYFVGDNNTNILVDAGITCKRITEGLAGTDVKPEELDGILVTHEHIDHVQAIGVLSRKYGIPVYATEDTIAAILRLKSLGKMDESIFHAIRPDESFEIKTLTINPSSVWHDAADPVCYSIYGDGKKISIATDMGNFDDYIVDKLKDSDLMVIEANHDIRMLQSGPYPYPLKQRILGNYGHLSNERSGQLIKLLLNSHIKKIFLAHLSKENNFPELAYEAVKLELSGNDFTNDVRDFGLEVARRDIPMDVVCL